ncbi:MAG: hypothetical protein H7330_03905 [Hymenobacteraceae bacterium]|nr:hypothetical protein [Hymenobacteraceae bacterium]
MRHFTLNQTIVAVSTALVFALGGCRDERDPILPPGPEAAGREYFPLAVGHFWEYDVEEHHWGFNRDSVIHFQFRERVDTVYPGATGETTYHIVRSRRADSLSTWREDSARDVVVTLELIRRTIANVPTIELLFPVAEGKGWNPNLFNAADSTTRTYGQVGAALLLPSGRRFDRTLCVVDVPQLSAVQRREQEAAYAWNIGCVYRRRRLLDYCNQSDVNQGLCQLGSGYIVRGFEREEQLRAWGPR